MAHAPRMEMKVTALVTPAKAGVHICQMDSRFRGLSPKGFRPRGRNDVVFDEAKEPFI